MLYIMSNDRVNLDEWNPMNPSSRIINSYKTASRGMPSGDKVADAHMREGLLVSFDEHGIALDERSKKNDPNYENSIGMAMRDGFLHASTLLHETERIDRPMHDDSAMSQHLRKYTEDNPDFYEAILESQAHKYPEESLDASMRTEFIQTNNVEDGIINPIAEEQYAEWVDIGEPDDKVASEWENIGSDNIDVLDTNRDSIFDEHYDIPEYNPQDDVVPVAPKEPVRKGLSYSATGNESDTKVKSFAERYQEKVDGDKFTVPLEDVPKQANPVVDEYEDSVKKDERLNDVEEVEDDGPEL